MNNQTISIFKPLFEQQLNIPNNNVCIRCNAKYKNPLIPWIVGSKYFEQEERLLFIGKPHRGNTGNFPDSKILDATTHLDWLKDCSWPYWKYTRNILEKLYGIEDPWDYACFTNLIKCTNVGDDDPPNDTTSYEMARNCIVDLEVIYHEIKRLEPKTIIFYTYSLYKELLRDFPMKVNALTYVTIKPENNKVKCGNKLLGWWERKISTSWSDNVRVLVTGHPQFMKYDEYVQLLTNWIRP